MVTGTRCEAWVVIPGSARQRVQTGWVVHPLSGSGLGGCAAERFDGAGWLPQPRAGQRRCTHAASPVPSSSPVGRGRVVGPDAVVDRDGVERAPRDPLTAVDDRAGGARPDQAGQAADAAAGALVEIPPLSEGGSAGVAVEPECVLHRHSIVAIADCRSAVSGKFPVVVGAPGKSPAPLLAPTRLWA